jgi:levanase
LFSFEDLDADDWVRTGDAFLESPVQTAPAGQSVPSGVRGRYVNSFHSHNLDGATGRLLSPAFTIDGDVIELKIGGGNSPDVGAALVVDGERVKTATGCLSEIMSTRAWGVAKYKGKSAYLEIYDLSPKGWSHVLVDEVVQWSPR